MKSAKKPISKATLKREGEAVRRHFEAAQQIEKDLTQDTFAAEIGVTQGLITQWFTGRTPIPDKRLFQLGVRLRFDPYEVRPSLEEMIKRPNSIAEPTASYAAPYSDLLAAIDALGAKAPAHIQAEGARRLLNLMKDHGVIIEDRDKQ